VHLAGWLSMINASSVGLMRSVMTALNWSCESGRRQVEELQQPLSFRRRQYSNRSS
jgi:hypothetical protein